MRAKGFVFISETDVSVFYLRSDRGWGTVGNPLRFETRELAWRWARKFLSGGAALNIPGGRPRLLSAHTAGF